MRLQISCLTILVALAGCATPARQNTAALPNAAAVSPITAQNQAPLYLTVVEGLARQGRHAAALAFLDGYAAKEKNLSPNYWLLRGNALLAVDRAAEADAAYARLTTTALAAEGWNGKGRVAASRRQWRSAVTHFRRAVQGSPANADFLNNLAYGDMKLGQAGTSVAYLRQAHELQPSSSLIRNNLIIALTLSGDRNGADTLMKSIADPQGQQEVQAMLRVALADKTEKRP
jgi:Flp pilus assembly protein TadD